MGMEALKEIKSRLRNEDSDGQCIANENGIPKGTDSKSMIITYLPFGAVNHPMNGGDT